MTPPPSRTAILALLVVTFIWGWTFIWMTEALDTAREHVGEDGMVAAVGLFMMVRFGMAALGVPLVLKASRPGLGSLAVWRDGGILAAILLAAFLLQMFGLQGVGPAVSAFLTSLYVAFTALISRFTGRTRGGRQLAVGVVLATVGAGFISGPPQLEFDLPEWLTVLCALLFAVHILATDIITRRVPPLAVSVSTFAWVTLGSGVTLIVGWILYPELTSSQLTGLLGDSGFYVPALLTSILGTGVALTLLNQFQKQLDPVRAAILYALEPVWASAIALGVGMGTLDHWLVLGGGALLAGNLIAELGPSSDQSVPAIPAAQG
jgi:drug/metabolite transporter (DMT)-like permease